MKFNLSYEWQNEAPDVRLDSHRSTWADLTIGVDGRFFTSNSALSTSPTPRPRRDHVSVSVFPLAEFIAANWWAMLYEPYEKALPANRRDAFEKRHWIDQHTDGFAYPKIGFFGADSSIRLVAERIEIPSSDIYFLETTRQANYLWEGLHRDEVEMSLLTFLRSVVDRLPQNDDRAWLKETTEQILTSRNDQGEATYCRFAGLLGEDPYEPGNALYQAITQTVELLGKDVAAEMCATSEMADIVSRAAWIENQASSFIKRSSTAAEYTAGLREALRGAATGARPWERGYRAARKLRELLDIPAHHALDRTQSVSRKLFGFPEESISIVDSLESTSGARSILFNDASGLGLTLSRKTYLPSAKFQTAAIFADFVFSPEAPFFLSTRAATDRQKCNRAFAAELLAPIDGIREHWTPYKSALENIADVSKELEVSSPIVKYQVLNQAPELLGNL